MTEPHPGDLVFWAAVLVVAPQILDVVFVKPDGTGRISVGNSRMWLRARLGEEPPDRGRHLATASGVSSQRGDSGID